jgi:hypothetical protein
MNCEEIRERFFEADTAAGNDVKTHLAGCTECARAWSAMQETMALLDEWKAPEASPFFDARLRARVAEVKAEEAAGAPGFLAWLRRPALGMPVWRPLGAGVLAVAVIFGVSMMNVPNTSGPGTPPPPKVASAPGTPVSDLQSLDNNQDAISHLELLDDLTAEENGARQADRL